VPAALDISNIRTLKFKVLWPGDCVVLFWGDMEAITVQKPSKYYTTEFDIEEGF
jgi:hypothetical protein